MHHRIRFAIIGTGKRSDSVYAPLLNTLKEEVELVGVWGRSEENARGLGEKYHVPWFTDLDQLRNELAVDAAIVSVARPANGEIGRRVIELGLHALLETPIAESLEDADAIIRGFANGALGFYNWSSIAYDCALRWQRSTRFFAELGMAYDDRLTILTSDGKDPQPVEIKRFFHNVGGMETLAELVALTSPEISWRNPFRAYYMDDEMIAVADCLMSLVNAIREDKLPEYGSQQARLDQEVTLAMYESARNSGISIRLPLSRNASPSSG